MLKIIFITYLLYNCYCFLLMCFDKWQATRNAWRISERALLLHAFFFGALGILVGIYSPLKHKINDWKFSIGVPLILLLEVAFVGWFFKLIFETILSLFTGGKP